MTKPTGASLEKWMPLGQRLSHAVHRSEHLANPFCNILNCTSKSEAQYPDLMGHKGAWWRLFHSIKGAGIILLRSCIYWPNALKLSLPEKSVDVVIISHLTSAEHLQQENDFYFGDLVQQLNEHGITSHSILINHARVGGAIPSMNTRTVLPAFLSPAREAMIIIRLIMASFTMPRLAGKDMGRFHFLARLAQFNNRAIGDYRIGSMLVHAITQLSPKVVIHTYEGHGWERIVNKAAHSKPDTICVYGYQHAVIFPGAKPVLENRGNATPDYVLTTGEAAKNLLISNSSIPGDRFSILGSIKARDDEMPAQFTPTGACLIAPEGTLSEVRLMADMGIQAARANPGQTFILRLHPVLSRQLVEKALSVNYPLPRNFVLSNVSLQEDLNRSSWLCYRGSTVSFQAVLAGLRPLYLDPDGRAKFNDPLPDSLTLRYRCATASEINAVITADKRSLKYYEDEWGEAFTFTKNYLMPFDPSQLIERIKAS